MTRYKSIDLFAQPVIDVKVTPYLSAISIAQNVPTIPYITISNPSLNDYTNVKIHISFSPNAFKDHCIEIDCITTDTIKRTQNISVRHCDDYLLSLEQPQDCQVQITITANEFDDIQRHSHLTILDDNSWFASEEHILLLPLYIQRKYNNVDRLPEIKLRNIDSLINRSSANDIVNQQKQQTYFLSNLAYTAIQNLNISIKESDHPFLRRIHSVKSYTELVKTGVGSIVDIVCLYSAVLQKLGLQSAVVISRDAMWVVVCLGQNGAPTGLLDSCDPIYRMDVLPVDVSGIDAGSLKDFRTAIRKGCKSHFDQRASSVSWVVELEAKRDVDRHMFSSDDQAVDCATERLGEMRTSDVLRSNLLSEYYPYKGRAGDDPLSVSSSRAGEGLRLIVESEGPMLDTRAFELYVNGIGLKHLDEERRKALNRALLQEIDCGHILVLSEVAANRKTRRIIRSPCVAPIFPRARGSRALSQIPLQEIQFTARLLLLDARLELSWCSENHLRCLAEMYELPDHFPELEDILNSEFPY